MLIKPKLYSDCYLYNANMYNDSLSKYVNSAKILDKSSPEFDHIMYTFKMNYPRWVYKFLCSNRVQFVSPSNNITVNKAFNTFACYNRVDKSKSKVSAVALINASALKKHVSSDKYVLSPAVETTMLGYAVSGFIHYTYLVSPELIIKNNKISLLGSELYAKMVSHLLNIQYRINIVPDILECVTALSKMFYFVNMLKYPIDKAYDLTKKSSKLAGDKFEKVTAYPDLQNANLYKDISTFIGALKELNLLNSLTLSLFIEKWVSLYGAGTEFATEMLPAFLTILSNIYVSSYACNITTLSQIFGPRATTVGQEIMALGGRIYG